MRRTCVSRFVALLRAVNVGGHTRVAMEDLKRVMEAQGFRDVVTYLQSGNAAFDADDDDPAAMARALEERLARSTGNQVPVLVLRAEEMQRIVSGNPFLSAPGTEERSLHVTFLFRPTDGPGFGGIDLPARAGEQAVRAGSVVYLRLPMGYGRTRLDNAYFERVLGTPATTRNWRTVRALAGLAAVG